MATVSSNSMSFLLDEVVSAVAFETFFEEPLMMPTLYSVRQSARRRERLASFGGLREYSAKTAGAEAASDDMTQQFEKDFVHTAYAKQVNVERELLDDQEYGLLEDIGRQLGMMAAYTMEKNAAAPFNDAFAGSTYTAEDGLSLCNDAHVNVDAGNSQDNAGTTALSLTAVGTTRSLMRNFKNYEGDLMSVRPNGILIPPDLEQTAWEIVRSTGRPDTTNRADNFYNGQFELFVWDFLSTGISGGDANNWFMLDTRIMANSLLWYQRVPLEIYGDGSLSAGTRKVGGYFRSSHGVRDWRFVYGHNVT